MGAPLHWYTCAGGGQILENWGKAKPKWHCGVMVEAANHHWLSWLLLRFKLMMSLHQVCIPSLFFLISAASFVTLLKRQEWPRADWCCLRCPHCHRRLVTSFSPVGKGGEGIGCEVSQNTLHRESSLWRSRLVEPIPAHLWRGPRNSMTRKRMLSLPNIAAHGGWFMMDGSSSLATRTSFMATEARLCACFGFGTCLEDNREWGRPCL